MRLARICAAALLAAALGCSSPPRGDAAPSAPLAPLPPMDPIFLDDFTALRNEFGARDDFHHRCEVGRPMQELVDRFNAEQWQGVLDISLPWLEQCPVDIDARVVSAIAYEQLGRSLEADPHKRWYHGLVDSVLASGDGKTAQTAFVVISVGEEYSMLRAMGLESKQQTLLDGGIYALTVEGEAGQETIYFNPASHWVRLEQMFGNPK